MTDWNLVNDGILAIEWLIETNNVENSEKIIIDLWKEKFQQRYQDSRLFNKGALMMASYLLFVYIREREYNNFNFNKVEMSDFHILNADKKNNSNKRLCTRLRNSISHGRFEIIENTIFFEDSSNGSDFIKFKIDIVKFGVFISNFIYEVNSQILSTKS